MSQVLEILLISALLSNRFDQVKSQTCSPNQCPKSDFDEDLVISPDKACYEFNDEVTLTCSGNVGGPLSNTCQGNGWTLPLASCEVFTCDGPISDNLILTPNETFFDAREKVTFSCEEGYELTGPTTAVCDGQDIWNPDTPHTCLVICYIPEVDNGTVTPDITIKVGDTATVTCDDGFSVYPPSSSTMTCQDDGTWSQEPQCLENCHVPAVNNSEHTEGSDITHDQMLRVSCNHGFSFEGETAFEVTCDDGQLKGNLPDACYENCHVPAVNNSEHTEGSDITHDQMLRVSCSHGFSFEGETAFEVTCDDGQLKGNLPDACYASCSVAAVNNSNHGEDTTLLSGQQIKITCNSGYSIDEMIVYNVSCEDGELSREKMDTCYASCSVAAVNHSNHREDTTLLSGQQIKITCNSGYSIDEMTAYNISCEDGELSGEKMDTCYEDCEKLSPPLNGQVSENFRHGTSATYSCSEGYSLNGTAEVTCENGEWNSEELVVCYDTPSTCEAPAATDAGLIIQPDKVSFNVNEAISYSCSDGRELIGPLEAICGTQGEWEPPNLPVCGGNVVRGVWLVTMATSVCLILLK